MSWIPEERVSYSWLDSFLLKLLKCGQVPKHVAFIMDGNRRFARQKNLDKIRGHTQGFEKLAETLQWCHDMDIKEVTVYAFSIENFNRPASEVEGLFNLAREKFQRLINEKDKLAEHGVRVNVLGKLELLPADLQELIETATESTRSNCRCVLNVAFAYTSREEMTQAVRNVCTQVKDGSIDIDDISEDVLERCFYTSLTGLGLRPDLLIRTSGENRLSDFLLWQTSYSITYFTQVLWPDFSLKNFMLAIFYYQRRAQYRQALVDSLEKGLVPNDLVPNQGSSECSKNESKSFSGDLNLKK